MYVGIDIGSSSSKVAIIDKNKRIMALSVINMGTGTDAGQDALAEALEKSGLTQEEIRFTVATGYGRLICEGANKQVTEITCHAKGTAFLMKDIKTVIDIGGQDAKVIKLNQDGSVANFTMNEKCAAGTGRFMEVMARVLGCKLSELSSLADRATREVSISSICTVFAESEVISRLATGEDRSDVARGAHMAIAKRIAGMCGRVGCEPQIAMTGGVALNGNMVDALSKELKAEVKVVPHAQSVGAIGAAVIAWETAHK